MPQTVGEYLGKTKPPVIHQHAVSDVYRKRAEEMWGNKLDEYCDGCGRLPAWCECYAQKVGERIFGEHPKSPFAEIMDREGLNPSTMTSAAPLLRAILPRKRDLERMGKR